LHQQSELVVLIGFMGAGKSTIGRALARRLGWRFVDLDRWIERREHRRIAQIFADEGEAAFRAIEADALATVLSDRNSPQVLALGGGAWVQPANADRVKSAGARVVFLDASIEQLRRRCGAIAGKRPLFQDEEQFRKLYATRRQSYMQAHMRVDTSGRSVGQVADELAQLIQAGMIHAS
jgi:shikimate kinase